MDSALGKSENKCRKILEIFRRLIIIFKILFTSQNWNFRVWHWSIWHACNRKVTEGGASFCNQNNIRNSRQFQNQTRCLNISKKIIIGKTLIRRFSFYELLLFWPNFMNHYLFDMSNVNLFSTLMTEVYPQFI